MEEYEKLTSEEKTRFWESVLLNLALLQNKNVRSDTMYTVTEVAKKFSVSRQTVLKWINNGKIKAVKVVKVYRIPKEEIDRLIDKQRKEDEKNGVHI